MTTLLRIAFWLCIALAIVSLHRAAHAEVPADVQSACTKDAVRLCPMPALLKCAASNCADVDRCLRMNRRRLSDECVAALRRWSTKR